MQRSAALDRLQGRPQRLRCFWIDEFPGHGLNRVNALPDAPCPVAFVDALRRFAKMRRTAVKRSGPRNLDSGLSEISIVFQAAVPKLVASK